MGAPGPSILLADFGRALHDRYWLATDQPRAGCVDALNVFPDDTADRTHGPSTHWLAPLDADAEIAEIARVHGIELTVVTRTVTRALCPVTGSTESVRGLLNWPTALTRELMADAWLEHIAEHPHDRTHLSSGALIDLSDALVGRVRELLDAHATPTVTARNLAGLIAADGPDEATTVHVIAQSALRKAHRHEDAARALAALEAADRRRAIVTRRDGDVPAVSR